MPPSWTINGSSNPSSGTSAALVWDSFQRYVTPYTPAELRTMNRVSSRLVDSGIPLVSSNSKCLIQTVPGGNVQFASRLKSIFAFRSGTENQRLFFAPSDQNGTFTS